MQSRQCARVNAIETIGGTFFGQATEKAGNTRKFAKFVS